MKKLNKNLLLSLLLISLFTGMQRRGRKRKRTEIKTLLKEIPLNLMEEIQPELKTLRTAEFITLLNSLPLELQVKVFDLFTVEDLKNLGMLNKFVKALYILPPEVRRDILIRAANDYFLKTETPLDFGPYLASYKNKEGQIIKETEKDFPWGFSVQDLLNNKIIRDKLITKRFIWAITRNKEGKIIRLGLDLSDFGINDLTGLDKQGFPLSQITELDLSRNQLSSLNPKIIEQFKNLREVDLSNNKFEQFPNILIDSSLKDKINKITFDNNEITSLPDSFGQLKELRWLNLSNNDLQRLPNSFGELTNLKRLFINSNRLTALPPTIGNLPLTVLEVMNNRLKTLPFSLIKLLNYKKANKPEPDSPDFQFDNNPLNESIMKSLEDNPWIELPY